MNRFTVRNICARSKSEEAAKKLASDLRQLAAYPDQKISSLESDLSLHIPRLRSAFKTSTHAIITYNSKTLRLRVSRNKIKVYSLEVDFTPDGKIGPSRAWQQAIGDLAKSKYTGVCPKCKKTLEASEDEIILSGSPPEFPILIGGHCGVEVLMSLTDKKYS